MADEEEEELETKSDTDSDTTLTGTWKVLIPDLELNAVCNSCDCSLDFRSLLFINVHYSDCSDYFTEC